jgi:hypothetical protein
VESKAASSNNQIAQKGDEEDSVMPVLDAIVDASKG